MSFNVLSLWQYKKPILCNINTTFYDNCYFFIAKLLNLSFLIKHIIYNFIFDEKLDSTSIQNNITIFLSSNFFYCKAVYFSNSIILSKYVNFAYGN